MKKDTELGQKIANIIKEGALVPSVSSHVCVDGQTITIPGYNSVTVEECYVRERSSQWFSN